MARGAKVRRAKGADAAGEDGTPIAVEDLRLISDLETLRALSDPLRLRILELMSIRIERPWSVKELAARLDVPQTRLYHHVELLLGRDLVRAAEQRVVSGIIETRYRVAARTFQVDRRLITADAHLEAAGVELLHTVFDSARNDLVRSLHAHYAGSADEPQEDTAGRRADQDPDRPLVNRGLAQLTPARAAEFRQRLLDLLAEYGEDDEDAGVEPWGLLIAFYRIEGSPEEGSDA